MRVAPALFVAAAVVVALPVVVGPAGCATEKPVEKKPPPPPPPPPPPDHARTWDEVPEWYGTKCPAPVFTLDTPHEKTAAGASWTVLGTKAKRNAPWTGPLIVGVLGAVKDAEADTRANLEKAKKEFNKAGVNVILLNGDVADQGEIHEVATMLADVLGDELPVLVHSGNAEWTGGFSEAFFDVEKAHPNFFNLNLIRDLDLGGVHIVSMPGWSVKDFVKPGGCFYKAADVDVVRGFIDADNAKGELVVLTAHGPPRGPDKLSLDATHDYGNVGDESLAKLLQDGAVSFGIFGHILESGGRATADPVTHKGVKLPMKKGESKLFVNVGSASSFAIEMIDGSTKKKKKTSRGLAAIYALDLETKTAKVTFLPLRTK